MVHFASIRHPAAILDDLHGKVLNEAYQISKSTVTESVSKRELKKQAFAPCFIFFWDLTNIYCTDACFPPPMWSPTDLDLDPHRAKQESRSTSCPRQRARPLAPSTSPTARRTCPSSQIMWKSRASKPTSPSPRWDLWPWIMRGQLSPRGAPEQAQNHEHRCTSPDT